MADIGDRYHRIASDDEDSQLANSGRWMKVAIALVCVSCLVVLSTIVEGSSGVTTSLGKIGKKELTDGNSEINLQDFGAFSALDDEEGEKIFQKQEKERRELDNKMKEQNARQEMLREKNERQKLPDRILTKAPNKLKEGQSGEFSVAGKGKGKGKGQVFRPTADFQVGENITGSVANKVYSRVFVDVGAKRDASFVVAEPAKWPIGNPVVGFYISAIDVANDRISLMGPGAREEVPGADKGKENKGKPVKDLEVGELVSGPVVNIFKNRVFVDIGAAESASFLAEHPEKYKEGDPIETEIVGLDIQNQRIHLPNQGNVDSPSERGPSGGPDPRISTPKSKGKGKRRLNLMELSVGQIVEGPVINIFKNRVFVDIGAVESASFLAEEVDNYQEGDTISLPVAVIDLQNQRVRLPNQGDVTEYVDKGKSKGKGKSKSKGKGKSKSHANAGGREVSELSVGEEVEGTVTSILGQRVWADIGATVDGSFLAEEGAYKVGDPIVGKKIYAFIDKGEDQRPLIHLENDKGVGGKDKDAGDKDANNNRDKARRPPRPPRPPNRDQGKGRGKEKTKASEDRPPPDTEENFPALSVGDLTTPPPAPGQKQFFGAFNLEEAIENATMQIARARVEDTSKMLRHGDYGDQETAPKASSSKNATSTNKTSQKPEESPTEPA